MAKLFGPKEVSQDEQARRDAQKAAVAAEQKLIALIIDGVSVEDAVAECQGTTVEQANQLIASKRVPSKGDRKPYRATDADLH
jgi:hypothetical protein